MKSVDVPSCCTSRQNIWVGQICGERPTFYKRSMAYRPQHWDWEVEQTEIIV